MAYPIIPTATDPTTQLSHWQTAHWGGPPLTFGAGAEQFAETISISSHKGMAEKEVQPGFADLRLDSMYDLSVLPNCLTINAAMSSCEKSSKWQHALHLFYSNHGSVGRVSLSFRFNGKGVYMSLLNFSVSRMLMLEDP